MTPGEFIQKWRESELTERAAAQTFFNDLCELLGEPKPADIDPDGSWFTFERGAQKSNGARGWADVWKKGFFAWEMKGKGGDLRSALLQLRSYAVALENPPLLVVSDFVRIQVYTNFTNTPQVVHEIALEDLWSEEKRRILKWVFSDPEQLKPGTTRESITEEAAGEFAALAETLRQRGYHSREVAHFLNKIVFCLFAEDTGLLPPDLFSRMLENAVRKPERFRQMAQDLFSAMKEGGHFGLDVIDWFNGGLFDDAEVIDLDVADLRRLARVAKLDWAAIEPSIFGTLFERGLDPDKRSQLGAHYTDAQSIQRIVQPVVLEPLRREWEQTRAQIEAKLAEAAKLKSKKAVETLRVAAHDLQRGFLERLMHFRVLDPACGSGNFLYLALIGLKNLEQRVLIEGEELGLHRTFPAVDPSNVVGIEINSYAAELARVTVWIGHLQWIARNGGDYGSPPLLKKLDQIECRDALINPDGTEAKWPAADCIVGNPPFLGDKKMIAELGEEFAQRVRALYEGRVPGGADYVTYWFAKGWDAISAGRAKRAGFVATNSIRGGRNRVVLDRIGEEGRIFEAWSDEPWVLDGAAVRVSIVCFDDAEAAGDVRLDGVATAGIFSDLTARAAAGPGNDFTEVQPLKENAGLCFQGIKKVGAFDIDGELARLWLQLPANPNGCKNRDVLRPYFNGICVTRRPTDTWIIDFGVETTEAEAAFYELPFRKVASEVRATRAEVRRNGHREYWWRFGESRPALRRALAPLSRYIVTPEVSKHRVFAWLPASVLPDGTLFAIAKDDDVTLGVLHSRFHEVWSLRLGTSLEDRPRYTSLTTFETFPFPEGLTPDLPAGQQTNPHAAAIGAAAKSLCELRERWLNPPELVIRRPEVVPGYPDRLLPKDEAAAAELKKRTLTNLYNERPRWLALAHEELDAAVAAAYGWPAEISEEEALARLFELNRERAEEGR